MTNLRPTCWTCFRPKTHCHCNYLPQFTAFSNIVILQHPRERRRFYTTTNLLSQWISNCRVLRGIEFRPEDVWDLFPGTSLCVLFPSKNVVQSEKARLKENSTVLVLDGTWREAGKIYRSNPWIAQLKHITFTDTIPSNYRIRRQPKMGCLSSIEAVAHMFLENCRYSGEEPLQYQRLLRGFTSMVDTHLESIPEGFFK